jgi:hypothetical protein
MGIGLKITPPRTMRSAQRGVTRGFGVPGAHFQTA